MISRVTLIEQRAGLRRQSGELGSSRCSSDRRTASKRSRSATTVWMAPRDRCHAANFASSSRTIGSARSISDARLEMFSCTIDLQVVDVVEKHLLDLADGGLDVARHGHVEDEQRIAAARRAPIRRARG